MWKYTVDAVAIGSVFIPLLVAGLIMRSRTNDLPRTHLSIGRPVNHHVLAVPPPERWRLPLILWAIPDDHPQHHPPHHHELPVARYPTPPPPPPYPSHTLDIPFLDSASADVVPPGYRHAGRTFIDVVPPAGNGLVPGINANQNGQSL